MKLTEFAQAEQQLNELRASNQRLSAQLQKKEFEKDELARAVYQAAKDSISGFTVPRVPTPPARKSRKPEEVAISLLSDLQIGKRTPTYNTDICKQRVEQLAAKIHEITAAKRYAHNINQLRVYLLGDLVEGELVFPSQAHRIDASLYRQVCEAGPRILTGFLRSMLSQFKQVHVVGVIGNHGAVGGRSRKEMHPETNADFMLYRITREILSQESRLTWDLPFTEGERSWYAVDTVLGHRFLLFHGQQMQGGGFAGLPYYGFARAIASWASGVIPGSFEYCVCGHFHNAASIPFNHRVLWVNGTTESDNTWAQEELKSQSLPNQWLLFCGAKHGVTTESRLWLQ
jgi:hypothetical protein